MNTARLFTGLSCAIPPVKVPASQKSVKLGILGMMGSRISAASRESRSVQERIPAKSPASRLSVRELARVTVKIILAVAAALVVILGTVLFRAGFERGKLMESRTTTGPQERAVHLPSPKYDSSTSIEKALRERRSERVYRQGPLSLEEVAQLLWAAQGMTHQWGFRTAPSAGALYPLETYLVAGHVSNLPSGVYRYQPRGHELAPVLAGDVRGRLCAAALNQDPVCTAPASIVLSAVFTRSSGKYGQRGIRYSHMEAGIAAQNISLQAVSLGLGTAVIGAFHDDEVRKVLSLPAAEEPMIIMPVGKSRAPAPGK